jgi:L-lysine exporter family protein LysE/ArgO
MSTFIAGFSLGLSLIFAIGSQNAFVLKQGLKNEYVFIICVLCALSDAILIGVGVGGFGAIVNKFPEVEMFARYGGAIFLSIYSLLSFKSAFTIDHALHSNVDSKASMAKVIVMSLAFTWLNPHVYLDTVILLGSISTQYQPNQLMFAIGAMTASFVFFFSLGYGSRCLAPVFKKPISWKILEFVVGIVMGTMAISLLY